MSTQLLFPTSDVETGGKEANGIEADFAYRNNVQNADVAIRMGFLRKVYGILSVQLLLTVAIVSLFMFCKPVQEFAQNNSWMVMVSFLATFVCIIVLFFVQREHPTNLVFLGCLTVAMAYTLGTTVSYYDAVTVLEALFITMTVVIGISTFTLQSKRDFSFLGLGLFIGLWVLLLGGILQIFVQTTVLEIVLSIGGAMLFSLFLVYDTHLLMRIHSPEDYIIATINIYLDIINLFLYILRILLIFRK